MTQSGNLKLIIRPQTLRPAIRSGTYARNLSKSRQHGVSLQAAEHVDLVDGLRGIPSTEICWIDARDRNVNGLLLTNFFDFT